jgi:hypothetical protein
VSGFRFALQPLLDARRRTEDEARARTFAAANESARERERAAALRAAFVRAGRALHAPTSDLGAVRDALAAAELYGDAVARADAAVRRAAEREAAARAEFARVRAERRQVEALRDRARAAFRAELALREERELDEAAGARHNAATLFASSFHN